VLEWSILSFVILYGGQSLCLPTPMSRHFLMSVPIFIVDIPMAAKMTETISKKTKPPIIISVLPNQNQSVPFITTQFIIYGVILRA
jgi:hypothetical protein